MVITPPLSQKAFKLPVNEELISEISFVLDNVIIPISTIVKVLNICRKNSGAVKICVVNGQSLNINCMLIGWFY
jgi:hypothetical protein